MTDFKLEVLGESMDFLPSTIERMSAYTLGLPYYRLTYVFEAKLDTITINMTASPQGTYNVSSVWGVDNFFIEAKASSYAPRVQVIDVRVHEYC